MDKNWELGEDLSTYDSLLDGLTFDDLILAVYHNCRIITPEAVRKELDEMLASRMQDMKFLLEKNMAAIMEEAGKERDMTFEQLCKDFEARKPKGEPVGEIPWFNVKWENGNDSTNDLLCRFLRENGFEYIHTYNGDVWFLYYDVWERCTCEVKDGCVHFYMCKFDD